MASRRPNFLIVLADDLGFSDVGCFGGEIRTPNIDKLGYAGIRMTDFHAAAACSPSRAMLLSGTDAHIAGLGTMQEFKQAPGNASKFDNAPGYEGYLNHAVAALPEVLQDAGYYTVMAGKWHLGHGEGFKPAARGFSKSVALLPGACNHYNWQPKWRAEQVGLFRHLAEGWVDNDKTFEISADKAGTKEGFYASDYITDRLISYLEERTPEEQEKPFMAYLPFTAPHWPLQVSKEYSERYRGMYDQGPDVLRMTRLRRAIELGLLPKDVVAHDVFAPEVAEWTAMTEDQRKMSARAMEVYAGMVECIDDNVGRVVDYLKTKGELENTMVLFLSDNGAEGLAMESFPVGGPKVMQTIQEYYNNEFENIGNYDSFAWYGPRWAQAATSPGWLYKGYSAEGGIRVPLLCHYPPFNASRRGITDEFATIMDIMPTMLDLAGVEHPGADKPYRGRKVVPMRGRSWTPYMTGKTQVIHNDTYSVGWELFGKAALRRGPYKATFIPPPHGPDKWQLFDIKQDPGETADLSAQKPQILKDMLAEWERYSLDAGVLWEAPEYGEIDLDEMKDPKDWMPLSSKGT